jgi:hypothetical protein
MLKKLSLLAAAATLAAFSTAAMAQQAEFPALSAPPGYVIWPSLPVASHVNAVAANPAGKQSAQIPLSTPGPYDALSPAVGS